MKLNHPLVALFLLSSILSFSQQMPIDFSSSTDNFETFGNSGFSFGSDPDNPSNAVGQFFNDGSIQNPWQGFYIILDQPLDLNEQSQLTLSFFQEDPIVHSITVKLENGSGSNPDIQVVQSTSGTGWANDITFDFSNATISGTNNTTNGTGQYSQLTIYIDGGISQAGTYLIDNINDDSEFVDPNILDVIYTDLVWADEFGTNGAIDSEKWFRQTQLPGGGNWFNGEEQHYTNRNENSFVYNGFLNIVAIKEPFTDQGETKQYTSARLNSKYAFTHGRVDVRAKLPFGDGTWPAIWTLGKNINEDGAYWDNEGFGTTSWPASGEIDVMEHGLHAINEVSSALHTPSSYGNTINTATRTLPNVAENFHVYSMNWSPDQITFLIDGVGYYTYNPAVKNDSTWPFELDQYLLLNIAMGGVSGAIDPNFDQSRMVIDYVRVYQNIELSIDEVFASKFGIHPNPVSNTINIVSQEHVNCLELYNTLGQLVLDKQLNTKKLNVQELESGIYVLKIYSGSLSTTKKILIN
jgi:beta-glucanase (GH16 family)